MRGRNPITEEIRAIRHRLAAEFDNDVNRIGAELRRRQEVSGRRLIRVPKRTPVKTAVPASNGAAVCDLGRPAPQE
jgi:hypothetical protein